MFSEKIIHYRNTNLFRVIDLFSGCGGLSLGFHRASFSIIGGVEKDVKAAESHGRNFFRHSNDIDVKKHCQASDITDLTPEKFLKMVLGGTAPDNHADIIIGGPPCQAFARIGRAKLGEIASNPQAYLDDQRASLYIPFLEYVIYFRPLAVLMENVPDILNFGGKNVAEEIAVTLENIGYQCRYTILDAANYGVPQHRLRFFLLAFANELGTEPVFPEPTHKTELPKGYKHARDAALANILTPTFFSNDNVSHYVDSPQCSVNAPDAVSAKNALEDLPIITYHLSFTKRGGKRGFTNKLSYRNDVQVRDYIREMREWSGFVATDGVFDHVIRHLPRDYRIFKLMAPGDEYPQAFAIAEELFNNKISEIESTTGTKVEKDSNEYKTLRKQFVPPYDPQKFPNKWWKLDPDKPVRTLTAHIGKDTYTHIHYDSEQARVISVREAARLQSFPDGFVFADSMNAAYRQIGNSVPPLLAYALAKSIKEQLEKAIVKLTNNMLDIKDGN